MAKKTQASSVDAGRVTFSASFKPSRAFNSFGFDIGLSLPIEAGETPQKAVDRVAAEVFKAVERHASTGSEKLVDCVIKGHEKAQAFDRFGR